MLIITGTGRSGTSMVAKWLDGCGLLPYKGEWVPQFNSGYEPADVSRVNSAIWLGNDPAMQSIPAQEAAIKSFDYPIIKDPKFFYGHVLNTWLSVRTDLKFLICLRKFPAVYKSRVDARQLNMLRKPEDLQSDLGKFISQLVFNKIPFEIVCFPDFLDNYSDVYDKILKLEPSLDLKKSKGEDIWKKTVDKSISGY